MLGLLAAAVVTVTIPPATPTVSAAPGDSCRHCLHETVLTPIVRSPWITERAWSDAEGAKYGAIKETPADQCAALNLDKTECEAWNDPNVGSAVYADNGVTVSVNYATLGQPYTVAYLNSVDAAKVYNAKVVVNLWITRNNSHSKIDLNRFHFMEPCGPGAKMGTDGNPAFEQIRYFRTMQGQVLGPNELVVALLLSADSTVIDKCTLRLSDAIHSSSGRLIPDMKFRKQAYNHPEILQ